MDIISENKRQTGIRKRFRSYVLLWKILFFSILVFYCLYYAPYGINETDGGFLSGLAWQLLNGKMLYGDVVYVRPPLPVWLRALELEVLPEHWAILGERWIFYLKVGFYSWLGAALLRSGAGRWVLATFGFVVSAHCYPPMAWHTVDGILFSVLGIWCLAKIPSGWGAAAAGLSMFAALLCKQSFYPMAIVFTGLLIASPAFPKVENTRKVLIGLGVFSSCIILFISYLYLKGLLQNYFQMTGQSSSGAQALQHGVLDYFGIPAGLILFSAALLAPVAWHFLKNKSPETAFLSWILWLAGLAGSYVFALWSRKDFSAPFSQSRLLFWIAAACCFSRLAVFPSSFIVHRFLPLLAVSWCASVSWGYNLPILFSTPSVFAVMDIARKLKGRARLSYPTLWINLLSLSALLLTFRLGYEFVYRDGRRSDMDTPMGHIFPRLGGIYSTPEKGQLYLELKNLASRYPDFKTLPAFPQANFLTQTRPPLPLDWVVRRETNGDNSLIIKDIQERRPVFFIEKAYSNRLETDPELQLTRDLLQRGTILDETPHFWVLKPK